MRPNLQRSKSANILRGVASWKTNTLISVCSTLSPVHICSVVALRARRLPSLRFLPFFKHGEYSQSCGAAVGHPSGLSRELKLWLCPLSAFGCLDELREIENNNDKFGIEFGDTGRFYLFAFFFCLNVVKIITLL